MAGRLIDGRYWMMKKLGEGGMGAVYRVKDRVSGRTLALKRLQRVVGEEEAYLQYEFLNMVQFEHPHIVHVYEYGIADGRVPYFTMDYISGPDLRSIVDDSDYQALYSLLLQILDALDYLHARGVVHGDLKPSNILVEGNGGEPKAKLTDFGLAHRLGYRSQGLELTGTLPYMAPEMAGEGEIDQRADLYSLGVVLYELLAGVTPFQGGSWKEVMLQKIEGKLDSVSRYNRSVPQGLEEIVLRLMECRPYARYQAAWEVAEAVDELTEGGGGGRKPGFRLGPGRLRLLNSELVGREEEVSTLRGLVAQAKEGRGHFVLVSGEAGIGKSRLMQELKIQSQLAGALCAEGRCHHPPARTYEPFGDLLLQVIQRMEERCQDSTITWKSELVSLMPELAEQSRMVGMERLVHLEPAKEKIRLSHTVTRFLKEVAQSHPLVMVIEDLQWADQSSLDLLRYLGRNIGDSRIFVSGTYRIEEADQGRDGLEALVEELAGSNQFMEIGLEQLNRQEVRRVVCSILGARRVSPDLIDTVFENTLGNPLAVEELVRSLVEGDRIGWSWGRWSLKEGESRVVVPTSIGRVFEERLRDLDPQERRLLSLCSVVGREFDLDILQEVSGWDEFQVVELLERLLSRGVLASRPIDGKRGYTFAHPLMKEAVYERLTDRKRKGLHQRVAEALEQRSSIDEDVDQLAYHYYRAKSRRKARTYSLMAAEKAEKVYAHERAAHFYRQALEHVARRSMQALTIYMSLGDIYKAMGRYNEALSWCDRALAVSADRGFPDRAIYKKKGDVFLEGGQYDQALEMYRRIQKQLDQSRRSKELAELHVAIGKLYIFKGEYDQGLENYTLALHIAEQLGDMSVKAECLLRMGYVHGVKGAYQMALQCCQESLNLSIGSRDVYSIARAYSTIAIVLDWQGDYSGALKYYRRSLRISKRVGDLALAASSHNNIGNAFFYQGDRSAAVRHYQESLDLYQELGKDNYVATCYNNLGAVYFDMGDYSTAISCHEQHLDLAQRTRNVQSMMEAWSGLGNSFLYTGNTNEAIKLFKRALSAAKKIETSRHIEYYNACLGEAYLVLGEFGNALRYYHKTLSTAEKIGDVRMVLVSLVKLARLYAVWGDVEMVDRYVTEATKLVGWINAPDVALDVYDMQAQISCSRGDYQTAIVFSQRALDIAQRIRLRRAQGIVYTTLGRVHAQAGDWASAENSFGRAVEILEQVGPVYELGRAYLEEGICKFAYGNLVEALRSLSKAQDIFEKIDARHWLAETLEQQGIVQSMV